MQNKVDRTKRTSVRNQEGKNRNNRVPFVFQSGHHATFDTGEIKFKISHIILPVPWRALSRDWKVVCQAVLTILAKQKILEALWRIPNNYISSIQELTNRNQFSDYDFRKISGGDINEYYNEIRKRKQQIRDQYKQIEQENYLNAQRKKQEKELEKEREKMKIIRKKMKMKQMI